MPSKFVLFTLRYITVLLVDIKLRSLTSDLWLDLVCRHCRSRTLRSRSDVGHVIVVGVERRRRPTSTATRRRQNNAVAAIHSPWTLLSSAGTGSSHLRASKPTTAPASALSSTIRFVDSLSSFHQYCETEPIWDGGLNSYGCFRVAIDIIVNYINCVNNSGSLHVQPWASCSHTCASVHQAV